MSTPLLDQPLGSLAREIPGATRVFHAFNLDFCCGGHKSLREAAALRGIEPEEVVAELDSLQARGGTQLDWRTEPSARLIEHILKRYHARHREQLPELIRLACRVEQVHGSRSDCPNGLADLLRDMQQELESHMLKEEQILFPMLLSGYARQASAPISVMRFEHDHHGLALEQMEALAHGLTPPEDACNTWCALYRGLNELHDDLMLHIHLENNVLFIADQA